MTEELTERAEQAVADIESVAEFLRGPFFEAAMAAAVRAAAAESQSPWVDHGRGCAAEESKRDDGDGLEG